MRYFSINDLKSAYGYHPFEQKELFVNALNLSNLNELEKQEISHFLEVQTQQSLVFNAWIDQHEDLKSLLISGKTSSSFNDKFKWEQHQFFSDFQSFISPFFDVLTLKNNASNSIEDWAKIFSYFELIEKDHRFYLEQKCYTLVKLDLDKLFNSIENQLDRKQFESEFNALLSPSVLSLHSYLSAASNRLKIEFIERVLGLFKHPFCSAKLANWVLLQLQKMKLNEQQISSLNEIKAAIISGEYVFNEPEIETKKTVFKRVYGFYILATLIIAFLIFIFKYDFSMKPELIYEGSALKYFTVKERKEIDSVIRSMDSIPKLTSNPEYYGSGLTVLIRKSFTNKIVEKLFIDLETDCDLHYTGSYDTILKTKIQDLKSFALPNTQSLIAKKNGESFEFKNESDYAVLLICWEEKVGGKVHSYVVSPQSTIQTKIAKEEHFLMLPGFDFGEIPAKNLSSFKLLEHHFGTIDFNFESAFQEFYVLKSPLVGKNKVLFVGKKGEVVEIMDVNGVFERI
ncbi:MAG: hypothetical protein FGM14_02215 [Flavobacteriales bacterium]|nr:hypothetical protein [Flavobacteriales bacterium]